MVTRKIVIFLFRILRNSSLIFVLRLFVSFDLPTFCCNKIHFVYLVKQLDDLDVQARQLRDKMEAVDLEINDLENKLLSADIIKENFKVFRDVYDHLTVDEKYDLPHLLVKKAVYYEEPGTDADGNKSGKIKMDLRELPPIDPSISSSTDDFAERHSWLSISNDSVNSAN